MASPPHPTTFVGHSGMIGVQVKHVEDIRILLRKALQLGFGFICTNTVSDFKRQQQILGKVPTSDPFIWHKKTLKSRYWEKAIAGVISDLQYELNGDDAKRLERAIEVFQNQVNYCSHLRIPVVLIELHNDCSIMAALLNRKLKPSNDLYRNRDGYWIKVEIASVPSSKCAEAEPIYDPWQTWNTFRISCGSDRMLFAALELSVRVPSEEEAKRWLGEPVKALFIRKDAFITNDSTDRPVLGESQRSIVKQFMRHKARIVLDADFMSENLKNYYQTIHETWDDLKQEELEMNPAQTKLFSMGFSDVPRLIPQPISEDVDSRTYGLMESDEVKYELYQKAICHAILDKKRAYGKITENLVVMVVGAGRGPLVEASLVAAQLAGADIKVYAIEKNFNAVKALWQRQRITESWRNKVTIIHADIRSLGMSQAEKVDIVVSELLGSFGDNDLSPECLEGAQVFLKDNGIMIPKKYSSFINPIMCSSVYSEAVYPADSDSDRPMEYNYETPYVIRMNNKYEIDETQELFTFKHPNRNYGSSTHERYAMRKFTCKAECLLHGFAGYFEAILYGELKLSIHPPTYTSGLYSWEPMFFPLSEPVHIKKDQEIIVHFYRKTSDTKVWYEWTITAPHALHIHNANGRASSVCLQANKI